MAPTNMPAQEPKSIHDLLAKRRAEIGTFLSWARDQEQLQSSSLRWRCRPDIEQAKRAAEKFAEQWWGVVVYSCFMSEIGTGRVAKEFVSPLPPNSAEQILSEMDWPSGSVKSHRKQPANKGAKTALVSACEHAEEFRRVLLGDGSFHERYSALGEVHAPQWGRTTRYDLVLRAGALGVGGHSYCPDRAYRGESTGPRKGFAAVLGIEVDTRRPDYCEDLLRSWTRDWHSVAAAVGVKWVGDPYDSGDFENALCIYQEHH